MLNIVRYDKGSDNPKPNPNFKSFVALYYSMIPSPLSFLRCLVNQFKVLCHTLLCLVSPLSFFVALLQCFSPLQYLLGLRIVCSTGIYWFSIKVSSYLVTGTVNW